MELVLDEWQKQVLETKGNIAIRAGRQVGKSTIISILAGEYAANNKNKEILVISATERQAYLLFSKILMYLDEKYRKLLKTGKDRPTKSEIKLKTGCIIRCLPTGMDGLGIRGYTTDVLIADEAHFIQEGVWDAVTPQLITTGGRIIVISTTHGREGFFYRCFSDPNFTTFHITTEQVAEKRAEPQRTQMLEFLTREKERMNKRQFAQEYLAEFVDDFRQFFSDDIIKKACVLKRRHEIRKEQAYYLGVDIARLGDDQSTFEILDRLGKGNIEQVENLITTKTYLNETTQKIIQLEKEWKFKKIGIDDGGIGVGVTDYLLNEPSLKFKVVTINNRSKSVDANSEHTRRLLKEDLYNNLLALLERGALRLLDDDEIVLSLKSIQFEYTKDGKMEILGNHDLSHVVEGLTRAAWLVAENKDLNLWMYSKSNGFYG